MSASWNTSEVRARLAQTTSASALALAAIVALPGAAFAQDAAVADAAEEEAIVVTGIRASINQSVEEKMESTSIVEVISAEDIGKLPDQSIAESLSRLPGLATQRLDGRANVVSIRGLAPDFTTTLLNGREQVSASNNRGVELDQYPSELLTGAVIYKTPDASLIGQAIGGTIDMKTARPLSFNGRTIAVGLRGELNDLGELNPDISNKGYRANFSYIDQNEDGTVGWAFGYARMVSPTAEERWQAWGYPTTGPNNAYVIGGAKPYVKSNELTRDGVIGVVELQPDDKLHVTFDGYWSSFKDNQRLRGIELPLQWSGAQLQPGYTVENGLITAGRFNGVEAVMRNDVVHRNSKIISLGGNVEYKTSDTLTLELDASYSRLKKLEENVEIYTGTGRGGGVGATDSLGFALPANGGVITFSPTINYANPALFVITDPQGWNSCGGTRQNCQDGFINRPRIRDELKSLRLQATKEVDGFLSSIRVGANYSDRKKSLVDEGFVLTHKNYPANTPVPSSYLYDPVALDFIGIPGMVSFNSWKYYKDGNYTLTPESNWNPGRFTNSYVVREKVLTGYVQANIDSALGSSPLRGNAGIQVVHTNQSGDSFISSSFRAVQPYSDGAKYTEILPSLNLSLEVGDKAFIRFGAARMLARARMDQINPGGGVGFSIPNNNLNSSDPAQSPWSGSVGNAQLKPLMADTVDLAFEKYFGKGGYFAVGGFFKHLENYIYRQSDLFDFTGIAPPTGVTPRTNVGLVSQWVNGRAGRLWGAEASLSLPFSTFSETLDGFGLLASASLTNSRVRENGPPIDMPGLSKWVVNGTAYYENSGFQARVSGRYRSAFLAEVSGLSLARDKVMAKAEMIVDAQIGYTFQGGTLEGVSVLATASNLTNEPFITYLNADPRQVRDYQNYGRNYMLGISYKF